MNAKCSILSLALLAAWLSAAGTEPTNVVVHWQSTSPSGASRIATAAYYDGLGRHVASVAEDASPDGGDIVEIKEYDAANLPEKVTFEGETYSLAYLYDAAGRKLRASYGMFASQRPDTAATVVPLFPIRPMANAQSMIMPPGTWRRDYCGNVIYKDGQIERVLTPEGYAVPDGEGWKRYVYVRDVQGNIRAVVGENNAVAEQTDYYPYGMPMADVNSASAQPFKFGGKELEREGGMDFYDFEARRLDFALGRFTSPDPLCEQTPEVSPYAYCAADPVNFIDPTGEDVVVLLEEGFIGHLGMLIQNEKEKWQYYSINGDNVFVSNSSSSQSSFIGGRRYDDIGVGEWDTPQDFLDSSYNTDDDNNDSEKGNDATTNSYEYTVGYQIESSPEQDKAMRNEIKNISKTEEYGLSRNNCASAVIKTLEAAGFEFNESIHSIFADFPDTVFTEIKNKIPNGKTYYKTNKENTSK